MNVGDPQVDDAGEPDVRIRQPVVDRWRDGGARPRRHATGDLDRDEDIGEQRAVRTVLLGRADRHEHRVVVRARTPRPRGSSSRRGTRSAASSWVLLCVASGDVGGELADALDPAGHDVARLEVAVGAGRRREPGRRAGRDQVARLGAATWRLRNATISATEKRMSDVRPSWIGLAVDRAAEAEVRGIEIRRPGRPTGRPGRTPASTCRAATGRRRATGRATRRRSRSCSRGRGGSPPRAARSRRSRRSRRRARPRRRRWRSASGPRSSRAPSPATEVAALP